MPSGEVAPDGKTESFKVSSRRIKTRKMDSVAEEEEEEGGSNRVTRRNSATR